jgi:HSP20 family protein
MNELTTQLKERAEAPLGWLRTEIDRLFDDFGRPTRSLFRFGGPFAHTPALEMSEHAKDYRLTAELPGLKVEDIDIVVTDGMLTIKGEKRSETDDHADGLILSERRYGAFERSLRLPADIDAQAVSATFKKGVLTVTMPKDESVSANTRHVVIAGD